MNIIPDVLTSSRGVMAIFILLLGVLKGDEALPIVVLLIIACWVTDVLDGKLARQSKEPTRLGNLDPIVDWVLSVSVAFCMVLWKYIPLLPVLIIIGVVTLSTRLFHFTAPRKFFIGLGYGVFFCFVWKNNPWWAMALVGGLVLLIILNPPRLKQLVKGFLCEVAEFIRRIDQTKDKEDTGS